MSIASSTDFDTNLNFLQESISTCRFAQRVALIKNDVMLNEELDPKLMIQKLKREILQLKEELAMATGEQRTDDLSAEDLERLVGRASACSVRGYGFNTKWSIPKLYCSSLQASRQECVIENYFSCFSTKTYVLGTQKNRLN